MARRLLLLAATVAVLMIGYALPVLAGGSWMYTLEHSYEPGDYVVAVGYVQDSDTDGRFVASVGLTPVADLSQDNTQTWLVLGEVTVEDSGLTGYLANRVSVEFAVPADLSPGEYEVAVRNADGEFFGDLIGLMLWVGTVPEFERSIEWPLDEPRIADLKGSDVIAGPGWSVTVTNLRDGQYPAEAAQFMMHPETLPAATATPAATDAVPVAATDDVQDSAAAVALAATLDVESRSTQSAGLVLVVLIGAVVVAGIGYAAFIRPRAGG